MLLLDRCLRFLETSRLHLESGLLVAAASCSKLAIIEYIHYDYEENECATAGNFQTLRHELNKKTKTLWYGHNLSNNREHHAVPIDDTTMMLDHTWLVNRTEVLITFFAKGLLGKCGDGV